MFTFLISRGVKFEELVCYDELPRVGDQVAITYKDNDQTIQRNFLVKEIRKGFVKAKKGNRVATTHRHVMLIPDTSK